MNDTDLDRRLSAADPYARHSARDLGGADRALLDEIMAHTARRPQRSWRLPLAGALASAAVVAAALLVPAWVGSTGDPETPAAPPAASEPTVDAPIRYAAAVVEAAGRHPRLLVGEPGTAKSMLSELLSAAICGTSALAVQGTAGTQEESLRYGWNYARLLAEGPSDAALVPSPVMVAMRTGAVPL